MLVLNNIYVFNNSIGVNNIIDVKPIHSKNQNHMPFTNNKQLHPIIPNSKSIFPNKVGGIQYIIINE